MHELVLHIIELFLLLFFSLSTSILTACCPNHLLYRYFLLAMDRQTLISCLRSQNSTPFLFISKPSGNREKKKIPILIMEKLHSCLSFSPTVLFSVLLMAVFLSAGSHSTVPLCIPIFSSLRNDFPSDALLNALLKPR